MPNPAVRASARTLPETTDADRRAVLGSMLVAGAAAVTALPALAAACAARSHHPDAELFALIERAKTAKFLRTRHARRLTMFCLK